MAKWKKFTGSDEQLAEMRTAKHGWLVRLHDGTESFPRRDDVENRYNLRDISEYLICEPHPHAAMIKRWVETGQPVYCRPTGHATWIFVSDPAWNAAWEYSFNPPKKKEKEFIEVREYLCRSTNDGSYYTSTIRSPDSVKFAEQRKTFVRWLDEDWRKIEI